MLSCSGMSFATNRLLKRSSASTPTAIRKYTLRMIWFPRGLRTYGLRRLDLPQDRRAPFAHRGILCVFANLSRIIPAALAFQTIRLGDFDLQLATRRALQ